MTPSRAQQRSQLHNSAPEGAGPKTRRKVCLIAGRSPIYRFFRLGITGRMTSFEFQRSSGHSIPEISEDVAVRGELRPHETEHAATNNRQPPAEWKARCVPPRLSDYAPWYLRMSVVVHLLRRESSASLNPTAKGKSFRPGESGTVVLLLTASAAFTPRRTGVGWGAKASTSRRPADSPQTPWWHSGRRRHAGVCLGKGEPPVQGTGVPAPPHRSSARGWARSTSRGICAPIVCTNFPGWLTGHGVRAHTIPGTLTGRLAHNFPG